MAVGGRSTSRGALTGSAFALVLVRFAVVGCSPFGMNEETSSSDPSDGGAVGSEASTNDGEGPPARPCDASLCTDFDSPETNSPPFGWDRIGDDAGAGAEFVLVPDGRSAPNALRLSVDVEAGTSLYLEKDLAAPRAVTVSVAIRLDAVADEADRSVRVVELLCGKESLTRLKINTSMVPYLDTATANLGMTQARLTARTWSSFQLQATGISDADGGVVVARHQETGDSVDAPMAPCAVDVRLRLGNIVANSGSGVYVVAIDDVIVDWR